MLLTALRRTGVALLLVALVVTFPAPAAAAPADSGEVGVLDAWWGQVSDLLGQLFAVFAGSTEEPPPPPPPDYGMGVDPDGRLPSSDPDETTEQSSDQQVGSLIDPLG